MRNAEIGKMSRELRSDRRVHSDSLDGDGMRLGYGEQRSRLGPRFYSLLTFVFNKTAMSTV
jgi:hypothetical protein